MNSPPVVRWAGPLSPQPLAPTTLPGGTVIPVTSALVRRSVPHLWTSALTSNPQVDGLPCFRPTRSYSCKGNARTLQSLLSFQIRTDAPVLELTGIFYDGVGSCQTLIVNGQLASPKTLSANRGQGGLVAGTIRIDFGSRAMRDIWLQTEISAAYFRVAADDTVSAWDDVASEPSITAVGDSYLQGNSSLFGNGAAIAFSIAARLGIRSVSTDVLGGTGYWNSGRDLGSLLDRLPGHANDRASIYLVLAGLNDYGDARASGALDVPATSTYEEAVRNYLHGLRQANPTAVIAVTAPFCPIPPMSDATYGSVTLPDGQVLGGFLYKAYVQKKALLEVAGPWVYIDVLMGGGWLNSSGRTGDITHLQWLTGGTAGTGTTATYRPGNTQGGGGGGFGGIGAVPVTAGGRYSQAPELTAMGGTGTGLLMTSYLNSSGALAGVIIYSSGEGYTAGAGLPEIFIDSRFELMPATLGTPQLILGINPNGQYPLPEFAPPGVTDLNNIYVNLMTDMIHPSPPGAEYLARRLASNLRDAILAL